MEDDWSSLLMTERHARIRGALEPFRGQTSLYFGRDIPAKKLANARQTALVPATEGVIALIDCTVFGSAKNCIVFGETALYIHNSMTVSIDDHRGPARLDYGRLAWTPFVKKGSELHWNGVVNVERGRTAVIETAGSSFSAAKMFELFTALQAAMRHGLATLDERRPAGGVHIAPRFVERDALAASNDQWPAGLNTNADASVVTPPLTQRWEKWIGGILHPPAIARDFIVVVSHSDGEFGTRGTWLLGLELTTGREYWRVELPRVFWSRVVITNGRVMIKGGAYWHAYELETGEPRELEVTALSSATRAQLTLVEAKISKPELYAAFASELVYPTSVDAIPPLIAANQHRRVYAFSGLQQLAPSLRIADAHGLHNLHGDRRGELISFAMTEQHLFAGTRDQLCIATVDPLGWVRMLDTPQIVEHVSIGSDHVVTAGNHVVTCYR